MNADDLKALKAELLAKDPDADYPGMCFVPGRYYLGMFYVEIPKCADFKYGGNLTKLIWRYEGEPEKWHTNFRYRYYVDDSGSPDAPDRRSWWAGRMTGSEAKILSSLTAALQAMADTIGGRFHEPFLIQGNVDRFMELMRAGNLPNYLHLSMEVRE